MQEMSGGTTIIGLGELLWDCFGETRRPGGAPANVAFHAGQLGLDGVVCSRVGADAPGDELIEYLAERGLCTDFIQRDAMHATGRVTVDASRPNDPRYVIHEDAAWDHFEFDAAWSGVFGRASAVCFGTLAQRSPASREAIRRALAAADGALRVYDVNLRPPWYRRPWIEESLNASNVVKLNRDEVGQVGELLGWPSREPERFARAMMERYPPNVVCVTRGDRGCLATARDAAEVIDVAGRRVEVVGSVGSGDAFTAGLIRGLVGGWPLRAAVELANRMGALVAGHSGAMPGLTREYELIEADLAGIR